MGIPRGSSQWRFRRVVAGGESRLRGAVVQRIREEHFRLYPICADCVKERPLAERQLAVVLDHIVALNNGGLDFDEDQGTNRQGLCAEHHVLKTRRDMGYREDKPLPQRIGLDGFPVGVGGGADAQ